MKIRWTPTGFADIKSLHQYLEETAPGKTSHVISSILEALDLLARSPNIGRQGRAAGTRELVIFPYIIGYRFKHGSIEVIAIQHGARAWPESFD